MRVVVLGATGHIGSWLVPRLVNAGHDVIAVSRGSREPYYKAVEWDAVERVILDRSAAEQGGTFGNTIAALDCEVVVDLTCFDVESASHLVNAVRGRVALFLHCGTLWVHGVPKTRPYDETAVRDPIGEYGIRKAEIERYLLHASGSGFPACILHPGHITGPGWVPINPAGNLDLAVFEKLSRGDMVKLPGDGSATLQHVHADDVAQAFALAIAQPQQAIGQAFHVAAQEPMTMREYATGAASWFGREANLEFLRWDDWVSGMTEREVELTHDHVIHSPFASVARARELLGFEPQHTGLSAAHDAVRWLIENGQVRV